MNNIAPGQQIGPYRIINQIGQGGMATVYKAYHAAMDRYVAIKVLPSQFAQNKEFTQRFEQEARTIAKLEHAHILPVYDYGEHDSITYLVMRYLDAGTLKDRIQRGDLSLNEADKLFTQLAGALAYAHEMNVIHRDIKPSNAMVNTRGELFLTDFGIAKLLESTAQFTATGAITGTPAYMSPEQAQGEKLDSRSDIYSLGIVLYEMVTGKVPFEAETPLAVILKHINAPLPPPTTLKPDLPPEIEKVILKALAKNRDDRFATCDEFLHAWKIALTQTQTARVATPSVDEVKAAAPTLAASPTIMAAPAAVKEAPVPKKQPTRLIAIIGASALALITLCVGGISLYLYNQNQLDKQQTSVAVTTSSPAAMTTSSPTISAPSGTALPLMPGVVNAGEWKSWAALNHITRLELEKDRIVAGGMNGLTFWNYEGMLLDRFNMTNGLPHPFVTALFTDEDGSSWVGTEHGLLHIEGKKLTPYFQEQGIDNPFITVIKVFKRTGKRLIVGTMYSHDGGGLNEYDPQTNRFKPIKFPSVHEDQKGQLSYNITSVAMDKNGVLWVGTTNGLGRFDGNTWTRFGEDDGLGSNRVNVVYIDPADRLWAGTEDRGLRLWNGTRFTPIGPPDISIVDIRMDAKGALWLVRHHGVSRFTPSTNEWAEFEGGQNDLPDAEYSTMAIGSKDEIYVGTSAGLVRYANDTLVTWSTPNALAFPFHSRILTTPEGMLWFVERYGLGIEQFDARTRQWSRVKPLQCDCEPLLIDPEGVIIARQWDNGLWFVTPNRRVNLTSKNGLPSNRVTAAVLLKGTKSIWVGTEGGVALVDYADGSRPVVTQVYGRHNAGFAGNEIRSLFTSADRSLWVAMDNGLSVLRGNQWEHYTINSPFSSNIGYVGPMNQTSDGAVWVGTGDGVYRWKDGKWEHFDVHDGLPANMMHSIAAAPDGSVWIGTEGGLARFDGKQWQIFRTEPGKLIAPTIDDIYISPSYEVWLTTNGGVSVYKP